MEKEFAPSCPSHSQIYYLLLIFPMLAPFVIVGHQKEIPYFAILSRFQSQKNYKSLAS